MKMHNSEISDARVVVLERDIPLTRDACICEVSLKHTVFELCSGQEFVCGVTT